MPGTPIATTATVANVQLDKVSEIAIQDVVRYQEQLLKLIFFHDEKGHKVLSVYVTVIAAMVTAAFALNQINKLGLYAELFLGGNILSLLFGCVFAYLTAWTAPIYTAGRKPDFWMWAIENEQSVREMTVAYLNQSSEIIASNTALSERSARRLQKAYIRGLAAPLTGATAVWLAYWGLR
jgi:hypothetical protein